MPDDNPQLKVMDSLRRFMEGNFALAEDVAEHIKKINEDISELDSNITIAIKDIKEEISSNKDESLSNSLEKYQSLQYELNDLKSSIDTKVSKLNTALGGSISSVKEDLYNEVKKLYALIKDIPTPVEVDEQAIIDSAVRQSKSETEKLIREIPEKTGEEIVSAINSLPTDDEGKKIDASHIKNLPKAGGNNFLGGSRLLRNLVDVNISSPTDGQVLVYDATNERWVNSTSSGSGWTIETPTGSLYDQDAQTGGTSFTSSATAKAVFADGSIYFNGAGCTISGTSITMDNPVTQFIRVAI